MGTYALHFSKKKGMSIIEIAAFYIVIFVSLHELVNGVTECYLLKKRIYRMMVAPTRTLLSSLVPWVVSEYNVNYLAIHVCWEYICTNISKLKHPLTNLSISTLHMKGNTKLYFVS